MQAPPIDDEPVIAPKRSMAPFVVLGLLLVAGAGVGGYFVFGKSPDPTPKEPIAEPLKPVEPEKPADPVKVEEPTKVAEPEAVIDAGGSEVAQAPRQRVVPKGTLYKILRRSDGSFIDLGKGQRLREGDKLRVVGGPVDGKQREVYGQARVLELKARGTVADLLMEADGEFPSQQLYGFVDETVTERPKVAKVNPSGSTNEPAKTPTEEKPGIEVNPFPKANDPGKPPDPPLEKVEVKKEEPAPPAAASIVGSVRLMKKSRNTILGGGTESNVQVMVSSGSASGCDVHLPNDLHLVVGVLRSGDNKSTPLEQWAKDPRPDPNRAKAGSGADRFALVECKEGSAYFPFSIFAAR